jgi:myo-inositol-1(or 4)-monophosphatase
MNNNKYIQCIDEALVTAEHLGTELQSSSTIKETKGERDFALNADFELEDKISAILSKLDSTIPIFGEENQWHEKQSAIPDMYWVIDPIDGTVNYSRGIPLWGVSIALIRQAVPIASGLGFPALRERYVANKDAGAYLNGKRIKVSKKSLFKESIVGFGDFSVGNDSISKNRSRIQVLDKLANSVLRVRMPGTAALQLAWVASGRSELSITMSNNSWDVQGGVLLVREAGGEVIDYDGTSHNVNSEYTIATNKVLTTDIVELFKEFK